MNIEERISKIEKILEILIKDVDELKQESFNKNLDERNNAYTLKRLNKELEKDFKKFNPY